MSLRTLLTFGLATAFMGLSAPGAAAQDLPPAQQGDDLSGLHAFDLRAGCWNIHNHVLKERLANSHDWFDYEGTQRVWIVMGGYGNMDDNELRTPKGTHYGASVRTYDPKTGIWSIWWYDGRSPSDNVDPPLKGRFKGSVGTFYSDASLRDKPIKARFIWSGITATAAHWEQAFSSDGGKTWETNWTADFSKIDCKAN
ncbi:MAG TPA: DUF1579 domain-containing protein [Gammaproteobacteria bacterium]